MAEPHGNTAKESQIVELANRRCGLDELLENLPAGSAPAAATYGMHLARHMDTGRADAVPLQ